MSIQGLPGGITVTVKLDLAPSAKPEKAQEDTRRTPTGPPGSGPPGMLVRTPTYTGLSARVGEYTTINPVLSNAPVDALTTTVNNIN